MHGPGIDEPLAVEDGSGVLRTSMPTASGSIVKVTNAAGAVTLTRQYDAWGNLEAGASEPGYAFTGREWDPETGLYYYRARYYDAQHSGGSFARIPMGFGGGHRTSTPTCGTNSQPHRPDWLGELPDATANAIQGVATRTRPRSAARLLWQEPKRSGKLLLQTANST